MRGSYGRSFRVAAALVTAGFVVVGAAGCADESPDLPEPVPPADPPPAASPAPDLDPEDAAAAEEILAAFDAYMATLIDLSNAGAPGGTEESLAVIDETPVTGEAMTDLAYELLTPNFMAGHRTEGTLDWDARVTEIDWEYSPEHNPDLVFPLAMLEVCFDETNWTTVDAESGEVVEGPGDRYLSTVTAQWFDLEDDAAVLRPGWYIDYRDDSEQPC